MNEKYKMILWCVGVAAIIGTLSLVLYRTGYPKIAACLILIPAAMIVNGFIAEWEDNRPGGFNNPTEKPSKKGH
jgi:hypothetical protein